MCHVVKLHGRTACETVKETGILEIVLWFCNGYRRIVQEVLLWGRMRHASVNSKPVGHELGTTEKFAVLLTVLFHSSFRSTFHTWRSARSSAHYSPVLLCLSHGGRTQYPSKYSTDEVVLRLDFFSASVETVLCMRYPGFLSLGSLIFPNIIQSPLAIVAQFYTTSANILRYAFPRLTILLVIAICRCFMAEVCVLEVLKPF